jgi:uncharacterized glyoxalase superfamily protein PhnB
MTRQHRPAAYPTVLYRDAGAAIEWLAPLGFEPLEDHRDESGNVLHCEMALDSAIVMLGTAGAGRDPFRSLSAGGALVYVAVSDVDALCEKGRAAGADVAVEPMDTDYGSRDFTLRDPEGNLWSFGTYRPRVGGLSAAG